MRCPVRLYMQRINSVKIGKQFDHTRTQPERHRETNIGFSDKISRNEQRKGKSKRAKRITKKNQKKRKLMNSVSIQSHTG